MSAFALLFERFNTPIPPPLLDRMMERLTHRGPDGRDDHLADRLAMGHWHFWTTPEEVDERQPLKLAEFPFRILLDGRLDNRSELFAQLQLSSPQNEISDAALILHAYARWGEDCFEHFIGEYALVIHDEPRDQLICARDALGDRTLFYSFHGSRVTIASEPWAVTAAQDTPPELDEQGLVQFFAFQPDPEGRCLFKNVHELLPAQVMTITSSGERRRYSWQPDPSRKTRAKNDAEYAEQFLAVLEESTRVRMRSTSPVGVMMSGGLDSTSVACLAARMMAPSPLTTISFVFDDEELKDCDERIYINAVQAQWGTRAIQIPSDDAWPYKDWDRWPREPNAPDENVFRWVKERVYQRAHQEKLRVLLTGGFGDHLYAAGIHWLGDLLMEGRPLDIMRGLAAQAKRIGWNNKRLASQLNHSARSLIKTILPNSVVQKLRATPVPPPWLTPEASRMWKPETFRFHPVFERHENMLELLAAQSSTFEIHYANRHGIELRHPYRDRRLVEFVLSIPAHQLHYGGLYKHILRVATKGILPEVIRTRPRPTALLSLYQRGLQKEQAMIQAYLNDPNALWRKYVRADWLLDHWKINAPAAEVGTESMIAWLCVSFESWYKYADSAIMRSIIQ